MGFIATFSVLLIVALFGLWFGRAPKRPSGDSKHE
jgi:hypothetical protein